MVADDRSSDLILMSNLPLVYLEDVFVLKNKDGKDPEIFGLFSTTRWVKIMTFPHRQSLAISLQVNGTTLLQCGV